MSLRRRLRSRPAGSRPTAPSTSVRPRARCASGSSRPATRGGAGLLRPKVPHARGRGRAARAAAGRRRRRLGRRCAASVERLRRRWSSPRWSATSTACAPGRAARPPARCAPPSGRAQKAASARPPRPSASASSPRPRHSPSRPWKSSGDRLKALLEEWKAAPHVDRGVEQTMWKRFSAARNSFDRHRRAHFAKLATEQEAGRRPRRPSSPRPTKLADSTDWATTANEMRELMDRWKAAGRAGRAADEHLWRSSARRRTRSTRPDRRRSPSVTPTCPTTWSPRRPWPPRPSGSCRSATWRRRRPALRDVQERWEKVGHVPRADRDRVEGRLRRVEQAVREAEEARWRRSNPEARARAQATVDQLEAAIAKLQKQAAGPKRPATQGRVSDEPRQVATEARRALARRGRESALTEFSGR